MLYVAPEDEGMFLDMQKDLKLGGELVEPGKFHTTVRYVKDNNYKPFLKFIKTLDLPKLTGTCTGFEIYGEEKDTLVVELDGAPLHKWFNRISGWLDESGFPKSNYPVYKPHISLTEKKNIKKPEWKKEYEKKITFSLHIVTNSDYEEVYRAKSKD